MSSIIEKFEDLLVWQQAMDLTEQVYIQLETCSDFGFKDQIQRASVSVPSNIAEGFDQQTNKEFNLIFRFPVSGRRFTILKI